MFWPSPWEVGAPGEPSARPPPARAPDPYSPPRSRPDERRGDRVVAVAELPPALRPAFRFAYFNVVQSDCFDAAFHSDAPLAVAAPTGSGKTGVLELCLARRVLAPAPGAPPAKALYLAPSRALVQERLADWRARFGPLGVTAAELTGDATADGVAAARLVCATPEKLDAVTRGRGPRGAAAFVGDVGVVLIDEVHTLADAGRGATLEAVVARLKTIGAAPRMVGTPLATARYVAVSATLPNAGDVGAWLGERAVVRAYGDEVRPVPLAVVVRSYPPTTTDFLFERRLNEHLPTILTEFADGRPALIFCSSRKDTEATARALATAARRAAAGPAAAAALDAAAARVGDRGLADALRGGVGVHHAGLDAGDRGAVEALFAARALPVLCTTSTLATGVNLPAYLVVVKGTRRWVSEPGQPSGFVEYAPADILQMLGRAGRPQFDTRGVGVVMTQRGSAAARALGGGQAATLTSRLGDALDDALNAEIVLRTVTDIEGAAAWFKRTFLWATIAADPGAAGFPPAAPRDALERLAVQRHVATALHKLTTAGLARADPGGTALTPLPPGEAAARHYVRLATVATLRAVPRHAGVPDLLDAVCRSAELEDVPLRRGERKPLAALNRAAAAAGLPCVDGGTAKARIASPADKLYVLLVDACGPSPGAGLDFSLRREADAALRVGDRVAACAAAVFQADGALAGTANAIKLGRALRLKAWDDTDAEVRQLRGVATALGARLAAAGLGRLAALRAADAARIELATGRPYPFGAELLADAASLAPPPLALRVAGTAWRSGGRLDAAVTLTRTGPPPPRPAGRPAYGTLIVGTPDDDDLLLCERVAVDTFPSPFCARVTTRRGGVRTALVAALLPERVVGADVVVVKSFAAGCVFEEEAAEDKVQAVGDAPAAVDDAIPPTLASPAASPDASPTPPTKARKAGPFDRFRLEAVAGADADAAASVRRVTGGATAATAATPPPPSKGAEEEEGEEEDEFAAVFACLA